MQYTKEERMEIGRKILTGEMTIDRAALVYGINRYTARDYFRQFKATLTPEELQKMRGPRKGTPYYTNEERIDIGRQVVMGELTTYEASLKYEVSPYTIKNYCKMYKSTGQGNVGIIDRKDEAVSKLEPERVISREYKYYMGLNKLQLIEEILVLKGKLRDLEGNE